MIVIPQTNSNKDLQAAFVSVKNTVEELKKQIEALTSRINELANE